MRQATLATGASAGLPAWLASAEHALAHAADASPAPGAGPLRLRHRDNNYRVAAVITEYRPWSHADLICGRFIQGLKLDLTAHWTPMPIRAMYVDQFPPTDLSRAMAKQYGVKIAPSIRESILDDQGKLAVDGVLLIGEHGDYPTNKQGQHLYPRRRFFEETLAAFEAAGECVPVFSDKHLSARWEDGKWMYEKARALGVPLMAGSSLPLTWRRPQLEIPLGTPFDQALSVGYHDPEAYGFHALETLQCMVERRRGGETGVAAVQCLTGAAVWQAMTAGRFSRDLLVAALSRHTPPVTGDFEKRCPEPIAFFIEYLDGFKAVTLVLNPIVSQFLFAAKLTGDTGPVATQFYLQEPTFGHFDYLANAIMEMIRAGRPVYPVERTVLTTGILSTAMDSRFEGQRRILTPDLHLSYQPVDHRLSADRHPQSVNTRNGGWIELFNGHDLDGWRENRFAHDPRWEIKDGVLIGGGGQGYLATFEQFDDFELFAEVRITDTAGGRGNSGIYIRCQPHLDRGQEYPGGYEVQCDHGDGNNPTGSIYNLGIPGARAPQSKVKDGDWFTLRVLAQGNHLQSWVNGEPAADCRDPQSRFRNGTILLPQHHRTGVVEFRQVRLRRLGLSAEP